MSDAPAPTRAEEGREIIAELERELGVTGTANVFRKALAIAKEAAEAVRADGEALDEEIELHCEVSGRLATAEAEVARLQERVATLEAALKPFANYAADMPGADFGEGEIGEYYHDGFRRSIRTQDLRAARTALEAPHADN